jgi:hypothetical protein
MLATTATRKKRPSKRQLVKEIGVAHRQANGPAALIAAVIGTAAIDLATGDEAQRQDAARYFQSRLYAHHLSLLDLPDDLRPRLASYARRGRG